MSRSVGLTPAVEEALVLAVREGVPITSASARVNVDDKTVFDWLKIGSGQQTAWPDRGPVSPETIAACRAFYQRVRAASAELEAEQLESIREAAKTTGRSGVREWRAAAWLLENLPTTRQLYHQHKEVAIEHRGEVGVEHRLVREMTDAQLLELASPEIAGLLPPADRG